MQRTLAITGTVLTLALGAAIAFPKPSSQGGSPIEFDEFSMRVAINSTDLDSGIEYFSDTGTRLQHMWLQGPSGRVVFNLSASDSEDLGLTEVFWESSEPDIPTALAAYPEGEYTLRGVAFDGTLLESSTFLSHQMAVRPRLLTPMDGDQLDINNIVASWQLDPNVAYYVVEVSSDDFDTKNTIRLVPGISSFRIPPELVEAGNEAKVELGAISPNGNYVFAEVEFEILP